VGQRRKKTGGRTLLLKNPEVRKALLDTVAAGVPVTYAATYAGISPATLMAWLAKGRQAQERRHASLPDEDPNAGVYVEFLEAVEHARSKVAVRAIGQVQKVAQGGYLVSEKTYRDDMGRLVTEKVYAQPEWKAASWLLERSFRSEFGRSQYIELSAAGVPVGVEQGPGVGTAVDAQVVEGLAGRLAIAAAAKRDAEAFVARGGEEPVDAEIID
jgi:hypothetical protein